MSWVRSMAEDEDVITSVGTAGDSLARQELCCVGREVLLPQLLAVRVIRVRLLG